jgi:hypothetical protein
MKRSSNVSATTASVWTVSSCIVSVSVLICRSVLAWASKSSGANGVVELSPFEFLDRLKDLVPPPRKHRHRYRGVSAPNPDPAVAGESRGTIRLPCRG